VESREVLSDRTGNVCDVQNSFIQTVKLAQRSLVAHEAIDVELAALDDADVRTATKNLHELINTCQALQAHAIAEIGRRARQADDAEAERLGLRGSSHEEFVADELALLMSCTKASTSYLYGRATTTMRSASVMSAWRRGCIDGRKAESIAHSYAICGTELAPDAAARFFEDAIDYATRRTAPQLREWLRRREIAADPAAAERRRQEARGERRVIVRPMDDGMSELWALLPSVQARGIQQILDRVARENGSNDDRTMDQRRADALVELVTGEVDPPPTQLNVVVPADVLCGTSDSPAWLPGVGPMTSYEVRELAGINSESALRTTLRRLVVDPRTGTLVELSEKQYRPSAQLDRAVRSRDVTCRFPGCRRAALHSTMAGGTGTDLDHTVAWPQGPTSADNLAVLCRRHHRLKHSPGWSVSLAPDGTMTWTTPAGRTYTSEPWQYLEPTPERPDPPDATDPPSDTS
jgi:hypothetical protein